MARKNTNKKPKTNKPTTTTPPPKESIFQTMQSSKYLYYIGMAIVAIAYIWLLVLQFDAKVTAVIDVNNYYFLGKSLAQGTGFIDIMIYPEEQNAHVHFPPGYPVIIAIAMLLGFKSYFAVCVMSGIFLGIGTLVFYNIFYRMTNNVFLAVAAVGLCITNPNYLGFGYIGFSEACYICFTAFCCWLAINLFEHIEQANITWKRFAILVVLNAIVIIAAYFIRNVGMTIPVSFIATAGNLLLLNFISGKRGNTIQYNTIQYNTIQYNTILGT
ncbi:MAG: hypothetical protein LBO69_02255 [Ignavibacteria bacterium]|jgi:hypothetical protein|nr:hypothetical protein [Ignavibacteria bacterium]